MTLNNAEDAIRQAIAGGYDISRIASQDVDTMGGYSDIDFLTDPLFWQALGNARGWGKYRCAGCGSEQDTWGVTGCINGCATKVAIRRTAEYYAMQWFETHFSNGDETKFWQSLP